MPQPLTQAEEEAVKNKMMQVTNLLGVSALPDDVKTSFLQLVPDMSYEQLGRLIGILEQELNHNLDAASKRPEDQRLINRLEEATANHEEELAAAQTRAQAALQQIEDELPSV